MHIKQVYNKLDLNKKDEVYFEDYQIALKEDPNLLEIFDFLNKGVTDNFH